MLETFYTEAPKPTAAQLEAIEKLRNEAQRDRERAEESFQRCDIDGFVSQWASQIGAQKRDQQAKVLENGGCSEFSVLCDETGKVIATKVYAFDDKFRPDQWNAPKKYMWRLPDEMVEQAGRKWVPCANYKSSRIQKQLKLHEEMRWFPAVAIITTGGRKATGFGGMANAFVTVVKKTEADNIDD